MSNKFGSIKWDRVLAMAVLHDLADSVTGELASGFKRRIAAIPGRESLIDELEDEVLSFLLEDIEEGHELSDFVHQFNECQTKEAKIVKFADVLNAIAHARIRLGKTFDRYILIAKQKLEKYSPEKDDGIGKHLAEWLDSVKSEWDKIEPKPIG